MYSCDFGISFHWTDFGNILRPERTKCGKLATSPKTIQCCCFWRTATKSHLLPFVAKHRAHASFSSTIRVNVTILNKQIGNMSSIKCIANKIESKQSNEIYTKQKYQQFETDFSQSLFYENHIAKRCITTLLYIFVDLWKYATW